jgi:hypothetical protein
MTFGNPANWIPMDMLPRLNPLVGASTYLFTSRCEAYYYLHLTREPLYQMARIRATPMPPSCLLPCMSNLHKVAILLEGGCRIHKDIPSAGALDETLTNEERSSWRSVLVDELESWQWKRKAGRNSLHLVCIVYFHASLPSIYLHHPAVLQAPISSSRMQALYGLLHHAIEEKSGESRRGRKEKPEQRRRSSGNEIVGMFMSIMYLTQLNVCIILLFAVCPFIQLRLSIVLGQAAPTLSI